MRRARTGHEGRLRWRETGAKANNVGRLAAGCRACAHHCTTGRRHCPNLKDCARSGVSLIAHGSLSKSLMCRKLGSDVRRACS